ncbi:MAG: DUF4347 domain-containing protein, partial [Magnetococcales bacterium]|nr:DUF4347 domain-containing protein [Magnetococcales bacterium]
MDYGIVNSCNGPCSFSNFPGRQIVFITADIPQQEVLTAGWQGHIHIVSLPAHQDGMVAIARVLEECQPVDAIHILAHGKPGEVHLGTAILSLHTLRHYELLLRSWSRGLAATGEILLYGCNTAEGIKGNLFIQALAALTGKKIAASSHPVGGAVAGGTWRLDRCIGTLQHATTLLTPSAQNWPHLLVVSTIQLGNLDGRNGFRLKGENLEDKSGTSVSSGGDFNGDGFADVLIGAPYTDFSGLSSGSFYLLFGRPDSFSSELNLSTLNGTSGFRIDGEATFDGLGKKVALAGDVNGDGFSDLLISAIGKDGPQAENYGSCYVVFGRKADSYTNIHLSTLNGTDGFRIDSPTALTYLGLAIGSAGDINGDGYDDMVVASSSFSPNGNRSGSSFVIFGNDTIMPSVINISSLDGSNGFRLNGTTAMEYSGSAVSTVGDINGDGLEDLLIGASDSDVGGRAAGGGYLLFGRSSGFASTIELSTLDGNNGFQLVAFGTTVYAGEAVSGAGDINGDGYGDLILGAKGGDFSGWASGSSYVVFGKAGGFASRLELSTLNGSNGFRLDGTLTTDWSGSSVSSAGDVNGDGLADLLIGAPSSDVGGTAAGSVYLMYGKTGGFSSVIALSSLNGPNGFRLDGAQKYDLLGYSLATAGDLNADGFADMLLGAPMPVGEKGATTSGGTTSLILGKNFNDVATSTVNLTGTSGTDTLRGSLGDDFLQGNGGKDVLIGGNGRDVLAINNGNFLRIDGGGGSDTLRMDGSWLLDVTTTGMANRIAQMDVVDMRSGQSSNTLILNSATISQITDAGATLRVMGDGQDTLKIGGGWSKATSYSTIATRNYDLYQQGGVELLVDSAISVIGSFTNTTPPPPSTPSLIVNDQTFLVAENIGGESTVGSVTVKDGAPTRYTITGGSGQNLFSINPTSGQIRLNGGSKLDYETTPSYTLDLQITDGTLTDTAVVTLQLTDVDETSLPPFSTLRLTTLNGVNGFRLSGQAGSQITFTSIGSLGDWNGDGYDDLLAGSGNPGEAYVIFGRPSGFFPSALDLSTLDGRNGFRLQRLVADFKYGGFSDLSFVPLGDMNGDGLGDLALGGQTSAVLFGSYATGASVLDLSTLNGNNGFYFPAKYQTTVRPAGDINGDGLNDLLVSSNGFASDGTERVFVIYGKTDTFPTLFSLSSLDGSNGFRLEGELGSSGEAFFTGVGDLNGDGRGDLAIGGFRLGNGGQNSGSTHVVFGGATGFASQISLTSLDGSNGFRLDGMEYDSSGRRIAGAGDINGDGFEDLIIGANKLSSNGGVSYVLFGKVGGFSSVIALSTLDGTNGFRLQSKNPDIINFHVSTAGDVNKDGFDDLLISGTSGVYYPTDAFLLYGRPSGFGSTLNLTTLDGSNGFRLLGDKTSSDRVVVSSAGDVDSDGYGDLFVGQGYVVFGDSFTPVVTTNLPTQNFSGSVNEDTLRGGAGNDTLAGNGGNDLLLGGAGADLLITSDTTFRALDGGGGVDTLRLAGQQSLDLRYLHGRVQGIDVVDLMVGQGNHTLTLDAITIHAMTDAGSSLRIMGDGNDQVYLGQGWHSSGALLALDGRNYQRYQQGGTEVLVDATIALTVGLTPITELSLANQSFAVAENSPAASLVGQVVLTLPDNAPQPSFTIAGGTGAALFKIQSSDGKLTVADGAQLNFEGTRQYQLNVQVNSGSQTQNGVMTISLTDVSEAPVFLDQTIYIAENKAHNDPYTPLVASDPDEGSQLRFSILPEDATATPFSVHSQGYVDFKSGGSPLDYETKSSYQFHVTASDGSLTRTALVTVQVTDIPETPIFHLTSLNGSNGFRLDGESPRDQSGISVHTAGDVNGDGFDDFLIGAERASHSKSYAGSAYLVFGNESGFSPTWNLSQLNGINGFRLDGKVTNESLGMSVHSAGDVNGDGFDDMFVGAPYAPGGRNQGGGYILFGKSGVFPAHVDLSTLNGNNGFLILGANDYDRTGFAVSSAGDINSDGFADMILGAREADHHGYSSGATYVVFGKASGFSSTLMLSTLNGTNGFRLDGVGDNKKVGFSVSMAGDINGDGFDDIIAGDRAGNAYVIFGKASGFAANLDLTALNGQNGFRIIVDNEYDESIQVGYGGDINGDGFSDLLGDSFVIFGRSTPFTASVAASSLDGSNGFRMDNVGSDQNVSSAGDVNRDGFADILLNNTVIFGMSSPFPSFISKSSVNVTGGVQGFSISFGYSVPPGSPAGDMNGDGFDDLLLGNLLANTAGYNNGATWVIHGSDPSGANTTPQSRVTTSGADLLRGGMTADTLLGGGGKDVLIGGAGNDLLAVRDDTFGLVNGGGGNDTLRMEGGWLLDLTTPGVSGRLHGIDTLDMRSGTDANAVILNAAVVSQITDAGASLRILGDGNDRLQMGDGWTKTSNANTLAGQSYHRYNRGGVDLLVDSRVVVNGPPVVLTVGAQTFSLTENAPATSEVGTITVYNPRGSNEFTVTGGSGQNVFKVDASSGRVTVAEGALLDFEGNNTFRLDVQVNSGPATTSGVITINLTNINESPLLEEQTITVVETTRPGSAIGYVQASDPDALSSKTFTLLPGGSGDGLFNLAADGRLTLAANTRLDYETTPAYTLQVQVSDGLLNDTATVTLAVANVDAATALNTASTFQLSTLDGQNGFRLNGAANGDGFGFSVSCAGDINGDGFEDILIGAHQASPAGQYSGASYVVFGQATGFSSSLDISSLNGRN